MRSEISDVGQSDVGDRSGDQLEEEVRCGMGGMRGWNAGGGMRIADGCIGGRGEGVEGWRR